MDEDRLLERLKTAGAIGNTDGWTLQPAGGGLNTEVFFLHHLDRQGDLTVRLAGPGSDLRREAGYLSQLQDCPGIPRVNHVDRDMLVHERLPGKPRPLPEASEDDIDRLATTLACMHRHEADHYVLWPDPTPRRGSRADLLRGRTESLTGYRSFREPPHPELPDLYDVLAHLDFTGTGWQDERFALIHGDLSVGNILWSDTGVGLIDWEYVRPSDPAEELAYLITEQPVDDVMLAGLRDAYIAHGGPEDAWERVRGWAPFTALDSAFWWCDHLLERSENPADHPEVQARITTVKRWL